MLDLSAEIPEVQVQKLYCLSPKMFVQQALGNTLLFSQRLFALSFYIKLYENSVFLDMSESGGHV